MFIYFDISLFIVLVVILFLDVFWFFKIWILCFWFMIWVFRFKKLFIRRESVIFLFSGLMVVVCFGLLFLWKRRVEFCVIKYKIINVSVIRIVIMLVRFLL